MKNFNKMWQELGYKDESDFNIQLVEAILKYNFTKNDITQHGLEILEQIQYEASIDNINVVAVK